MAQTPAERALAYRRRQRLIAIHAQIAALAAEAQAIIEEGNREREAGERKPDTPDGKSAVTKQGATTPRPVAKVPSRNADRDGTSELASRLAPAVDLSSSLDPKEASKRDLYTAVRGTAVTLGAANGTERTSQQPSLPLSEQPVTASARRKGPRTTCPASDDAAAVVRFVANWQLDPSHPELSRFLDHHAGKGSLMANWSAAFRTWLGYGRDFAARGSNGARTTTSTDPFHEVNEMERTEAETASTRRRSTPGESNAGAAALAALTLIRGPR